MCGGGPGRVPQTTAPNAHLARDAIQNVAAQITRALGGNLIAAQPQSGRTPTRLPTPRDGWGRGLIG